MTEGSSLASNKGLTSSKASDWSRPSVVRILQRVADTLGSSLAGPGGESSGSSLLSSLVSSPIALGAALAAVIGLGALALSNTDDKASEAPKDKTGDENTDVSADGNKDPKDPKDKTEDKGVVASVVDSVKNFFKPKEKPKAEGSSLPAQQAPVIKGKLDKGDASVDEAISLAAKESGEDERVLRTFVSIESQGDPRAKHGSYLGLGQLGEDAWNDVKKVMPGLPKLTGKADDPRYDPVINARVTASYLGINRNRLRPAVAEAGLGEPTLMHLYAAHNLGYARVIKMLKAGGSTHWDERTRRAISGQAAELKVGGVGNYFSNAADAMKRHYTKANGDPSSNPLIAKATLTPDSSGPSVGTASIGQQAPAGQISIASSAAPVSVSKESKASEAVTLKGEARPAKDTKTADARQGLPQQPVAASRGSNQTTASASGAPDLFRTKSGMMATTG